MKEYYEILRDLREDSKPKLSQKKLAEILNTSQSAISDYESGKRPLPIEHLITLCKYYNVSTDYILGFPKKCLIRKGDIL